MKRFIKEYRGGHFDLIIIGGGITGAAVAYDASMRGLRIALVEKKDFGWATSAATTKMIHGGMRYLSNGEFGLVRESLRERRILGNIAPNFVYPIPFMYLCSNRIRNHRRLMKIGMVLYDMLSFDKSWTWDRSKKIPLHRFISRDEVLRFEPKVRGDNMTGASIFYDCQNINPERLTLAFIKSAVKRGAQVANYVAVEDFLYSDGKQVAGVRARDLLENRAIDIHGSLVINCGGPWADIILNMAAKGHAIQQIRRSEGIHLITKKLVNEHAVAILTAKNRHYCLVNWRGHTLIGTTDREYNGHPDGYRITKKSIMEFIDEINESYGDGSLRYRDVLFAYGGLRPLVDVQTEGTYASSRKYEIYDNDADGIGGLITVEGGKYTTSRNLAAHVVDLAGRKLGRKLPASATDGDYLAGCEIEDLESFFGSMQREYPDFSALTLSYVGKNYGTEYGAVLGMASRDKRLAETINSDGEILAEAAYAVREEMAKTLCDVLLRRTGMGTLGHPGAAALKKIARLVAKELRWSDSKLRRELAEAEKALTLPKN